MLAWGVACSARSSGGGPPAGCAVGTTAACTCAGGAQGAQTCLPTGVFGECQCGDGGATDGPPPPPPDAAMDVAREGGGGAQGPVFLSFGTDVTEITQGQAVTFTAVMTDPDGAADLVGGALLDESGMSRYGAFMASGGTGAYALRVTWDQVHSVAAIEFTEPTTRTFLAEFFDMAGHRVTRTATLRLHCGSRGACAGRCTDLASDTSHCGACDVRCAMGCRDGACLCSPGQTSCRGPCVDTATDAANCGGCGRACAPGYRCSEGVCVPPTGACADGLTCTGCSGRPGCGWCAASGRCFAGTASGPTGVTCGAGWTFEPYDCPGAPRCSAMNPAGLCPTTDQTCVDGACQARCGGAVCGATQVCVRSGGADVCARRCTSTPDCPVGCCAPLFDATTHRPLPYGSCVNRALNADYCMCARTSDCQFGRACAPSVNQDGDPAGPDVCVPSSGRTNEGCDASSRCEDAAACCISDQHGGTYCARRCSSSSTCGAASCVARAGSTCGATFCARP